MARKNHSAAETAYSQYYAYYPLSGDFYDHAGMNHLAGDTGDLPFIDGACQFNKSQKGLNCPIPIAKFRSRMPDFLLSIDCLKYPEYASYPNLFDAVHAMGYNGYNWQCVGDTWSITIGGQAISLPKSSLPTNQWMNFSLRMNWSQRQFRVAIYKLNSSGLVQLPAVLNQTRTLPGDATEGTADFFRIGHCAHYSSRQWGGLIKNVAITLL